MLAFASNSLLCRVALKDTTIDAASFTAIRLASGALILVVLLRLRGMRPTTGGSWPMAAMLAAYAAFFSFAYRDLTAATGALLLFGAVQLTMMGYGPVARRAHPRPEAGGPRWSRWPAWSACCCRGSPRRRPMAAALMLGGGRRLGRLFPARPRRRRSDRGDRRQFHAHRSLRRAADPGPPALAATKRSIPWARSMPCCRAP